MQKERITPLPSADITNPSIFGKVESLSSTPRSLNASLSQLSFSPLGSLSGSTSSFRNPNESRPVVKNYIAPTTTTKRHGSDIKVIYHADQLADKWENILPLTLGPRQKNDDDLSHPPNSENIIAVMTGQASELQKSPLALDSSLAETPVADQNNFDQLLSQSAADIVENLMLDIKEELVQQKEEAIRKSAELLVEYIFIDSLSKESIQSQNDQASIIFNGKMDEDVDEMISQESSNLAQVPHSAKMQVNVGESEVKDHYDDDCNGSNIFTESDTDELEFDEDELENLEKEQLLRKIKQRALKKIDITDNINDGELEEGTNYRNMVSGSWMLGLNQSKNDFELRDSVIFRGKKYSIKLNNENISCGDLFHKKYAFYFPIMLCDILSATSSAKGFLYIFFLQKRAEKGPKLRCLQLGFNLDAQAELWASAIIKRKWKEQLKNVVEKQALILVDKKSLDLLKLVKKYVYSIFDCTGKLYSLKEIEITDATTTVATILGSEARLYDTIVLFSNHSSSVKDSLQNTIKGYYKNVQVIESDKQDTESIDAVICASLLLNSRRDESDMCILCCSITRDKGLLQKFIGQFSAQDSKSIVNVAK